MKAVGSTETRNRRSVWTVTTKPYSGAHFATFPPDLIEPCILAGSPRGGFVLDPFGGSGTTAQVAMENNRSAILCELNPEYVGLINERLHGITPTLF
jgi:DNA modification methylase